MRYPAPVRALMVFAGGASLVAALVLTGIPPTSAFGASLKSLAPTTTTVTVPEGEDPSSALLNDARNTGDELLSTVTGTAGGLLGLPPNDGDGPPSDDDPPGEGPEQAAEEPGQANDPGPQQAPQPSSKETSEESGFAEQTNESSVLMSKLAVLRDLEAGLGAMEESPVPIVAPLGFATLGYVDVPSGRRSTREIVDALVAVGATPTDIAAILAPFPVAGPANYGYDWGAPRYTPYFHAHEGTDIFASRGTPVIATMDGVITSVGRDTLIGGNSLRLDTAGATFYYAHLDGFAPGIEEGVRVSEGTVLGVVGTTGNALGSRPHLHFEVLPDGQGPIPPLPYLDAWLELARQEAAEFVAARTAPAWPQFPTAVPKAGAVGTVFEPASSTRDSAGSVLLVVLAVMAYAARRWRKSLRAGIRTLSPKWRFTWATRTGRVPVPRESVDVLAPFLKGARGPGSHGEASPEERSTRSEGRVLVGVSADADG